MKPFAVCLAAMSIASASGQVFTFSREEMVKYTAKNPFERFEDGRPKVPDSLLEKFKELSAEDIWAVLPRNGFRLQYEDGWKILYPGRKLVGRAVTAQFMPTRPDVAETAEAEAKARGMKGRSPHQRVIDTLQPGDVLVVDVFGSMDAGGVIGDNLAFYVMTATKTPGGLGGFVIDGAIRDLEGIVQLDVSGYFRGAHPNAIRDVMLTAYNTPIRIGRATVMPGDIVFGDREGIYFIPPKFAQEIVDRAEETRIHDEWTKMKLGTGKYKSSEIYGSPTDPELKKEYQEYLKKRLGKK
ncbi:MAG: RraA family protein [Rhodospirillales bacterium]